MINACKISVIIPVCNMARYLDRTIASWTAQTLKAIEIICIDDGSSDGSLQKLQSFAQNDNRIQVYSFPENKSAWCARKLGIQKASGEYIMFADADDTVLPETCDELYRKISASQVDILHFQAEVINTGAISEREKENISQLLHPHTGMLSGDAVFTSCFRDGLYNFTLWDKIYRTSVCKNCIRDAKDLFLPRGQDKLLYFMLSCNAQNYLGITGKKYYQYHLGNGGSQNTYTLKQFEKFCHYALCAKEMDAYLKERDMYTQYEDILHKNRMDYLEDNILQWFKVTEEDKASGFDLMLRYWQPEEVIGKLAELGYNNSIAIAKQLQNAKKLSYDKHPVKTIATYYHKLANGGTERVLCRLCYIWLEMGYKVLVVTDQQPSKSDYPLPDGVQHLIIPGFTTILSQNFQKRAAALCNIIKEHHIDAFVHHGWWMESVFWDVLAIKAAGAALIGHHHSTFSNAFLLSKDHLENTLAPFALADACVTLSKTNYDFLKYFNPNTHITINPLSEDLLTWTPAKYQSSHRILWLGRLAWDKRPLDAVLILQEVLKEVPDAVLSIVGESEDGSFEPVLQNKIAELNLEDHVVYEGFHKDVLPWYKSSQIFLMTYTCEGYAMTLLESKTAGIPCVMYEMPYLTLCEGNKGLVSVPQGDINAAAKAVIKLLQNDTLCAQYGRDARAHLEELACFDFKKKWQEIFESVEHTHAPTVSNTEKMMMEMLIAVHGQSLQNEKAAHDRDVSHLKQKLDSRIREIQQLRHGNYIRRVARAVVPNRVKPCLKAILHGIPSGIKDPLKRLLRW